MTPQKVINFYLSWKETLEEYFSKFGEVFHTFILRDLKTGNKVINFM